MLVLFQCGPDCQHVLLRFLRRRPSRKAISAPTSTAGGALCNITSCDPGSPAGPALVCFEEVLPPDYKRDDRQDLHENVGSTTKTVEQMGAYFEAAEE